MEGASWVILVGLASAVLLANVAGDLLFFIGIDAIGVGKATAVTCSYPLFVTVISVAMLGESVTVMTLSATIAVIAGLVLLRSRSIAHVEGSGATLKRARRILRGCLSVGWKSGGNQMGGSLRAIWGRRPSICGGLYFSCPYPGDGGVVGIFQWTERTVPIFLGQTAKVG